MFFLLPDDVTRKGEPQRICFMIDFLNVNFSFSAGTGVHSDPKQKSFISTRRGILVIEMTQTKPSTIKFQFQYETVESEW